MLRKETIPIDFTGGLDKKTDPKLVLPGKLTTLENATFDETNTIGKDGGFSAISNGGVISGTAMATPKRLATLGDEALIEARSGLYSVGAGGNVQRDANIDRVGIDIKDIHHNSKHHYDLDVAKTGASASLNLTCWVWVERGATPAVKYSVRDELTGAFYVQGGTIGNGTRPRVIFNAAGDNSFHIYYLQNGTTDVVHYRINPPFPTTLLGGTAVDTGSSGTCLDVYTDTGMAGIIFLAFHLAVGGIKFVKLDTDGATLIINDTHVAADITSLAAITSVSGGVRYYVVVWCSMTAGAVTVSATYFALDSGSATATTVLSTGALTTNSRVTAILDPTSSARIRYFVGSLSSLRPLVAKGTINAVTTVHTAIAGCLGGVTLASKPFVYNSKVFVAVRYDSKTQPTLYVVDTSGTYTTAPVVARILPAQVDSDVSFYASTTATEHVPSVPDALGTGVQFILPVKRRGVFRVMDSEDVTAVGVSRVDLDFTATLQRTEYAGALVFAGACPLMYDGNSLVELGFNHYPDSRYFTSTAGGTAGLLSAGTYQWTFVYEWVDALGRVHQSAPAVPISATVLVNSSRDLACPTLRLTRKSNVKIVVYRTLVNGAIFYRSGSVTYGVAEADNDPTTGSVTINDLAGDADLVSQILYTEGDVLDNGPFPACKTLAVHQGRLVMGGLEDPTAIQYTEELRDGAGAATNDIYRLNTDPTGRGVTGVASMDDKLVLGCAKHIEYTYGTGPNRLGQFDNYATPQLADVGMGVLEDSADAMVLTPDGLWFRTDAGLRLLTRNLSVARGQNGQYVGAEVDTLVTGCVAAMQFPGKQQLRFYTGTIVLVFDYQWGQWSSFTDYTAVDAIARQSQVLHLVQDNTSYMFTTSSTFLHGSTAFSLKAETAWIKMAGVQGFQRVYDVELLGTDVAATTLKLEVGHDYSATYTTARTFATAGGGGVLQCRNQFAKQKCEAIRFRISETPDAAGNAGFSLANLSVQVGVKKGAFKLPGTSKF